MTIRKTKRQGEYKVNLWFMENYISLDLCGFTSYPITTIWIISHNFGPEFIYNHIYQHTFNLENTGKYKNWRR